MGDVVGKIATYWTLYSANGPEMTIHDIIDENDEVIDQINVAGDDRDVDEVIEEHFGESAKIGAQISGPGTDRTNEARVFEIVRD